MASRASHGRSEKLERADPGPRDVAVPTKPEPSEPRLIFSENCVPGNLRGWNEDNRKLLVQGGKEEGKLDFHNCHKSLGKVHTKTHFRPKPSGLFWELSNPVILPTRRCFCLVPKGSGKGSVFS